MASLGQSLKTERELRGITLREIADSTRISLRFLQALEEDKLDILPGKFFVRAILRSYAKAIGLDENQILNKYQEMVQLDEYEFDKTSRQPYSSPRLLTRRNLLILFTGLLIIAAGLVAFFALFPSAEKKPEVKEKTQEKAQVSLPIQQEMPSAETEPLREQVKGLNAAISFLEETWIQVFADGSLVWEGIKKEGEKLEASGATELRLNVGNAGGLTFTINGKAAKPLGPRGTVRKDISITLDNQKEFLLEEEQKED